MTSAFSVSTLFPPADGQKSDRKRVTNPGSPCNSSHSFLGEHIFKNVSIALANYSKASFLAVFGGGNDVLTDNAFERTVEEGGLRDSS